MPYRQTRFFAYPPLRVGRLTEAMKELLDTFAAELRSPKFTLSEQLPDYTTYTRNSLGVSDLESLCNLEKKELSTWFTARNGEKITILLWNIGEFLAAALTCETPSTGHAIFAQLQTTLSLMEVKLKYDTLDDTSENPGRVFIGHGRSEVWRELKDFIQDRLHLDWDEFNRETPAGKTSVDRLKEMLQTASFAFLIMTGEEEHADQKLHARENVIHEIGLFQGRLAFEKAIVLLEEGCEEFSNIHGLSQIRFPKRNIMVKSEEIRQVLEREGIFQRDRST